jgi:hypothetical protein
MKNRYLLLLPFLFLSTSFIQNTPERIWVGTIEVFFNPETNEFILNYNGNFSKCFTKYIIDHVYNECDSLIDVKEMDSIFQWKDLSPDSNQVTKKPSIKTTKM